MHNHAGVHVEIFTLPAVCPPQSLITAHLKAQGTHLLGNGLLYCHAGDLGVDKYLMAVSLSPPVWCGLVHVELQHVIIVAEIHLQVAVFVIREAVPGLRVNRYFRIPV